MKPVSTEALTPHVDSLEQALATTARTELVGWPDNICGLWPVLMRALKVAKLFLDDEGDRTVDRIITIGDEFCEG